MPVETSQTLNIVCDNPDCPGNELDPTDRTGWLFVSHEVYGEPTQQHVFCCRACVAGTIETLEAPPTPTHLPANVPAGPESTS